MHLAESRAPLELRLAAVPPSVSEARRALSEYARYAGADADDVELAVSEAVANSVLHGYPDSQPGTVTLRAELAKGAMIVVVADDGAGMRPNPSAGGLGLGLGLIGRLTVSFSVSEPERGGTALRMEYL